jgi:hypothetical protein
MGNSTKVEYTQEQVDRANRLWGNFTKLIKYGTVATIACVILLALITL